MAEQARSYAEYREHKKTNRASCASLIDDLDVLEWELKAIERKGPYGDMLREKIISLRQFHKNWRWLIQKQGTSIPQYIKWLKDAKPAFSTGHTKRPYVYNNPKLESLSMMALFVHEPVGKMLYVDYESIEG